MMSKVLKFAVITTIISLFSLLVVLVVGVVFSIQNDIEVQSKNANANAKVMGTDAFVYEGASRRQIDRHVSMRLDRIEKKIDALKAR